MALERHSTDDADPLGECAAAVRRHDHDRYLAALFAPREARSALLALYAFNLEIARVRETVSEPMLGQIRLQWWREAIAGIFDSAPLRRHAVVIALADAVRRCDLPRAGLDGMIDAREFDLEDRQPETLEALATYAAATSGELAALAATALGARDPASQRVAREAGTAWALAGLIRAVPFHAAQHRCYLPRDLLADDGALRAFYDGRMSGPARSAIAAVASRARQHLAAVRAEAGSVPRKALPALIPATLIESDLARLERADFEIFRPAPGASALKRQLRLVRAALRGRV